MVKQIKSLLYFPIAYYFRFFARIQLAMWKPTIIVVTGSSGKTTLLHLTESQIRDKARYSHQANSSYGIPFDILGLKRKSLTPDEWLHLFLLAPFKAFKKPYKENLYIVEADCDRPYEGRFLASLLKPKVTIWTNVSRTHTVNFDKLVTSSNRHFDKGGARQYLPHPDAPTVQSDSGQARLAEALASRRSSGLASLAVRLVSARRESRRAKRARMTPVQFSSVEEAIAYEFGYFLEATSKLAIVNSDSKFINKQIKRSKAELKTVSQKNTDYYKVFKDHTEFKINGKTYSINALLPKEAFISIQMTTFLLDYLKIKPDPSFSKFSLPPGRCNLLKGIKNTVIIDSTYNATPDGIKAILNMFDLYPVNVKWVVLGDMIELGNEEQEEHERLADVMNSMNLDKIILVGPRVSKYTYPKLKKDWLYSSSEVSPKADESRSSRQDGYQMGQYQLVRPSPEPTGSGMVTRQARTINPVIEKFIMPKDALNYLLSNIKGHEVILFKGARFLEGIIEHLLIDKNDVKKLPRRERIWQERRRKWNL
jgi:UDP-N-acetylmuramyl pentapeptide synthase